MSSTFRDVTNLSGARRRTRSARTEAAALTDDRSEAEFLRTAKITLKTWVQRPLDVLLAEFYDQQQRKKR